MSRLLVVAFALAACGGPRPRQGDLFVGHAEGPPRIECLPDPDVDESELSPRMRDGIQLATESFSIQAPPPPSSRAALDLQEWSSGPLREWLDRKTHAIEAARRELDAAAEESHRQRIMGGAIVGLMYEDVARVLARVPEPDDLDDEPEILDIYRQVIESAVRPFLETARRAYHACAANAVQPATMRHWGAFCRDREDNLPGGGPASGTTDVVVVPDE